MGRGGGATLTDMSTCANDAKGSATSAEKTKERNLVMFMFLMCNHTRSKK